MKKNENFLSTKKVFIILCLVGFFSSFIMLGRIPGGVNQDEAYAGYEAYSILHYGMDSHGYKNPVYFMSWGSGMNVLYSYLSIPFIAMFGLNNFSIRIVQVISSLLLLVFSYKFVKRISGIKYAMWTLFLLTISPWRILMSRWGLESNLAPTFIIIAWYFMVKVIDNKKYLICAFIFYGLSLYCYATLWIVVPIMIAGQVLYLWKYKKIRFDVTFLLAVLLLLMMAFPLMLFVLVQYGVIPEIRTRMFSIPLLSGFRGSEIGFTNIFYNLKALFAMIFDQSDNLLWNSDGKYGLYYHISEFFIVTGIIILVYRIYTEIKNKNFSLKIFYLINFLSVIFQAALISDINVNKINSIHVLIIICIAVAVVWLGENITNFKISYAIAVGYICIFACFMKYYYTDYNNQISSCFQENLQEAITWYDKNLDKDVMCVGNINYAKFLYCTKYPADKFVSTVEYTNYPDPWLNVKGFEGVAFIGEVDVDNMEYNCAYICETQNKDIFEKSGFTMKEFGDWMVAYHE